MKKGINLLIKIVIGCFLFVIVFSVLSSIFITRQGNLKTAIRGFYDQEPNSIDVLYIGGSSCYRGISPMRIWEQYGITGYNRGSSVQAPEVSYAILQDSLRTQSPKVVVLYTEWLVADYWKSNKETATYEGNLRRIVDEMPLSKAKLELIWEIYKQDPQQSVASFLFPLLRFHERWKEMSFMDYTLQANEEYEFSKGQSPITKTRVVEYQTIKMDSETYDAPEASYYERGKEIYQKCIDFCRERGIAVVLVKGQKSNWDWRKYELQKAFAEENQLPYIDLNLPELSDMIGFDYSKDMLDAGHLNFGGAIKFSDYLGAFLRDNYQLEDHRENPDYQEWNGLLADYYSQALTMSCEVRGNQLYGTLLWGDKLKDYTIAYRIYKDDNAYYTSKYGQSTTFSYQLVEPGNYYIRAYIKDKDGNIVKRISSTKIIENRPSADLFASEEESVKYWQEKLEVSYSLSRNILTGIIQHANNLPDDYCYSFRIIKDGEVYHSNNTPNNQYSFGLTEPGDYYIRVFVKNAEGEIIARLSSEHINYPIDGFDDIFLNEESAISDSMEEEID